MIKSKKIPLVYIIIINWNGGKMIEKCISSLKKTSYKNYKLLLVDNASSDDSLKNLKKIFPKMEILKLKKNYGCSPARNVAMKTLLQNPEMEYVCFMDSDILTIKDNWLEIQIKELEKKKEYGISGGKLVFPDDRLQVILRKNRANFEEKDHGQYDFIQETDAVWGACMVIKRIVIEKIGFLDESFFYGPDDVDYCYRSRKKGFKVLYNGFSKSIHIGSYSGLSPQKNMIYENQSYGMIVYALRHLSSGQKVSMIFRQLIRTLVTRKDPFSDFAVENTIWHIRGFPLRLTYFFTSTYKAFKNYSKIKVTEIKGKITN